MTTDDTAAVETGSASANATIHDADANNANNDENINDSNTNGYTQSTTSAAVSTSETTIKTICIIFAMEDEAQPCIESLHLSRDSSFSSLMAPFSIHCNESQSLFVICNGRDTFYPCHRVGTQWSAISAYLTIRHIRPQLIINAGVCGGVLPRICFSDYSADSPSAAQPDAHGHAYSDYPQCQKLQVFVGQNVIYSDRRIPFPNYDGYGVGNYALFATEYLSQALNIDAANIATSNAFDYTHKDEQLYKQHRIVCKDMECATIAEICKNFNVPCIALKSVSDFVASHVVTNQLQTQKTDYMANLASAEDTLAVIVTKCIPLLMGNTLESIGQKSKPKADANHDANIHSSCNNNKKHAEDTNTATNTANGVNANSKTE